MPFTTETSQFAPVGVDICLFFFKSKFNLRYSFDCDALGKMLCYVWYRECIVFYLPAILEAANVRYDYNCGLLCKLVYHWIYFFLSSFTSLQTPVIFPNNSSSVLPICFDDNISYSGACFTSDFGHNWNFMETSPCCHSIISLQQILSNPR